MATIASLFVKVGSDVSGLTRGLALGSGSIRQFGAAAKTTSAETASGFSGLQLAMVGALAVGAAAAIKAASEFESSMEKIQSLVGVSAQEVHVLSDEVLGLAKTVPVGPKELADALFFVTSAGFRGAQAMDILKLSAEGAAIGLGETKTVADVLTSAMNAYAGSGLTATKATDILIASVREGKFAPEELAASLGQVLPVAALTKVSLDQVGAAIAAMARQGVDVSRAATGIRFLLTSFIKPSSTAVKALASVGLSVQGLQDELAQQGLLATLQDLAQRFDLTSAAGKAAFANVVGGARGATVALGLVQGDAAKTAEIFQNVAHATGVTADAFATASKTTAFQFALLKSNVQVLAVQIGQALLPIVNAFIHVLLTGLNAIAPVLRLVADHAGLILSVFLGYGAIKFVPVLLGAIATALQAITISVVEGIAVAIQSIAAAAAAAAPAIAALGAAVVAIAPELIVATGLIVGLALVLNALKRASDEVNTAVGNLDYTTAVAQTVVLTSAIIKNNTVTEGTTRILKDLAVQAQGGSAAAPPAITPRGLVPIVPTPNADEIAGAQQGITQSVRDLDAAVAASDISVATYTQAMKALGQPVNQDSIAMRQFGNAAKDIAPSLHQLGLEIGALPADAQVLPADAFEALGPAIAHASAGLHQFSQVSGIDSSSIIDDFQKVATDGSSSLDQIHAAAVTALGQTRGLYKQWHDQIVSNFGGAGSALDQFANQSSVDLSNATGALNDYTAKIRQFGADTKTIQSEFGKRATDFLNWAQSQGLAQAGLLHSVATASKADAAVFVDSWKRSQDATNSLASAIQKALDPVFQGVIKWLAAIVKALHGVPPLTVKANTSQADTAVQRLLDKYKNLPRNVVTNVITVYSTSGTQPKRVFHQGGLIRHAGGIIPRYHNGGGVLETAASAARTSPVVSPIPQAVPVPERLHVGGLKSDERHAILQTGEFVVRRSAVQKLGVPAMQTINTGKLPRMHVGGLTRNVTENVNRVSEMFHNGGTVATYGATPPTDNGQMTVRAAGAVSKADPSGAMGWWNSRVGQTVARFASGSDKPTVRVTDDWPSTSKYTAWTDYDLRRIHLSVLWMPILRHELGHAFGLGHVFRRSNVMDPKTFGGPTPSATRAQVAEIRRVFHAPGKTVKRFHEGGAVGAAQGSAAAAAPTLLHFGDAMHRGGLATDAVRSIRRSGDTPRQSQHQAFTDISTSFHRVSSAAESLSRSIVERRSVDNIVPASREVARYAEKVHEVERMHSGGLRSDERHVILQTGEFVESRRATQRNLKALELVNAGAKIAAVTMPSGELRTFLAASAYRGTDLERMHAGAMVGAPSSSSVTTYHTGGVVGDTVTVSSPPAQVKPASPGVDRVRVYLGRDRIQRDFEWSDVVRG